MSVDAAALYEVSDATWPAARKWDDGPWTLRDGAGGGKRASAATARGDVTDQDIPKAEAAMKAMGQRSLFMIREGDDALDAMLAARGYDLIDEVALYTAPIGMLTDIPIPPVTRPTTRTPCAPLSPPGVSKISTPGAP